MGHFWRNWKYLYAGERRAITFLSLTFIVLVVAIFLLGKYNKAEETTQANDSTASKEIRETSDTDANGYYFVGEKKAELFPFDPNTADSTALLRLGLQPWQVRSIYKYRAKGGVYRRPQDFARLYGLTAKQYRILEPYIRIGEDYRPAAEVYGNEPWPEQHMSAERAAEAKERDSLYFRPKKLAKGETIDLNTADTTALKKVPGIGSGYARAIDNYRRRLGGFYSARQLTEIGGFPEEALPYFKVTGGAIRRMDINHMSVNQLRQHPYINFYQARAIVDYRRQRGPLKSLNQLGNLPEFPKGEIERLEPYVEYK